MGGPVNNLLGIYPILKVENLAFYKGPGTLFNLGGGGSSKKNTLYQDSPDSQTGHKTSNEKALWSPTNIAPKCFKNSPESLGEGHGYCLKFHVIITWKSNYTTL